VNKKEKILNAAIVIFSQVGYHNAKISTIADLAGVGTGTTYLYFKSKEQILEEVFIKSWTNIEQCLIELATKKKMTSTEKLKILVETIVDLITKNKEIAKLILFEERFWSSGKSERVSKMITNTKSLLNEIIKSGSKSGEFRKNINPPFSSTFLIGGLWYLMAHWAENFDEFKPDIIKKEAFKLVVKGME
jgi:TetR/AcrR family fatty acid metabolism transcriptional regulator